VALPFEKAYPWEEERGSTVDRTLEANAEAKRVYAQQEQLLPTLAHERPQDPAAAEHLHHVGRHVLILRDTTKRSRKNGAELSPKQSPKRVIPSRFLEMTPDVQEEDAGEPDRVEEEEDPVVADGRVVSEPVVVSSNIVDANEGNVVGVQATMLMDQEWDTRAWNTTKVQTAVDTLYEEIEHCEEDSRRELATTMLLRLLETHEGCKEASVSTCYDRKLTCICCLRRRGLRRNHVAQSDQQSLSDALEAHQQHQDLPRGTTHCSTSRVVCTRPLARERGDQERWMLAA
jgi:hypothetical protein